MRVELDGDEAREVLSLIVNRLLEEAGLPDEDRAKIRRWRSEEMRLGSDAMKALTQKLNDDLARALRVKERSQIQRHDWV
jgi:hypothetical protein